ncbi:hypothetical protein MNBD_GAMMA08-2516 [hydrothermal vent metagenome]|uniref:Teneurin NHL domain-containing protein n=1 Tax=hydrothermal vent metagenome TaxID=652676 RepID=A0A3B0XRI2_9ZZZZ
MSEPDSVTKIVFVAGDMNGAGNLDGSVEVARFDGPEGVAIDKAGNLFVTDSGNHTIRKITPEGIVSTFAGKPGSTGTTDGKAGKARFNSPQGITIDGNDQLYVVDRFNYAVRKITPDGVVSTIAGAMEPSHSEDGVGLSAKFAEPDGIAIDSKNNLYVTDGNAVRKISPSGVVTTLAGIAYETGSTDGMGSVARFIGVSGVATDRAGNVFVCDLESIRKITPSGEVMTFVGDKDDAGPIGYPTGIMIDGEDNLYVTDSDHIIHKISSKGVVTLLAGVSGESGNKDGPNKRAQFAYPHGLAIDKAGSIYIADTSNNAIRKISLDGKVITIVGSVEKKEVFDDVGSAAHFDTPGLIAADKEGSLYVVDYKSLLRKVTPAGSVTTYSKGNWNAINHGEIGFALKHSGFRGLCGVTTDQNNNVYVTDCRSRQRTGGGGYSMLPRFLSSSSVVDDKIHIINPGGEVSTVKISKGKVGYLQGIATDGAGNIYVVDNEKNVIFKVTPKKFFSASLSVIAGKEDQQGEADGVGEQARFQRPTDITRDKAGNLYVVDSFNYTIRKITPEGKVTTLAGKAGQSGVLDGVGAEARFHTPKGITVDSHGNIYVAEYYEHVIRKITPTGVVSTFVGQNRKTGFVSGILPGVIIHPYGVAVHGNDLYITMQHGVVVVKNIP